MGEALVWVANQTGLRVCDTTGNAKLNDNFNFIKEILQLFLNFLILFTHYNPNSIISVLPFFVVGNIDDVQVLPVPFTS